MTDIGAGVEMGPHFASTGYKLNLFSIKKSSAQPLVCLKR